MRPDVSVIYDRCFSLGEAGGGRATGVQSVVDSFLQSKPLNGARKQKVVYTIDRVPVADSNIPSRCRRVS